MKHKIENETIQPRTQRIITLDKCTEKLFSLGKTISVPADTVFIQAGDPPDYCYIIKSGSLSAVKFIPTVWSAKG